MKASPSPNRPRNTQRGPALRSTRLCLESLEDRLQPSISLGTAANFGVLGLSKTAIVDVDASVSGSVGVSTNGFALASPMVTITGNVTESSAGQYLGFGKVGGTVSVNKAAMAQADSDALAAATAAAALTPTVTLGNVTKSTTITGDGGTNVIDVNGSIKSSLILDGTASDVFVIDVTGGLDLSKSAVLGVGGEVTAAQVLYNFTGSGQTLTVGVGSSVTGTLLTAKDNISMSGNFTGAIIGGGQAIGLIVGKDTEVAFVLPAAVLGTISGQVLSENLGYTYRVTLTNSAGQSVTTMTDSNGNYSFGSLPLGAYTVSFTDDGSTQSIPVTLTQSDPTSTGDNFSSQ